MCAVKRDPGLDTLLEMATECLVIQERPSWWVKIRAWQVEPTEQIPHGIRYELTLHDHHGQRVFGMDNAHALSQPKQKRYVGHRKVWDHKHNGLQDKGTPYEFSDAGQLLTDFWDGVNETLTAHGYRII